MGVLQDNGVCLDIRLDRRLHGLFRVEATASSNGGSVLVEEEGDGRKEDGDTADEGTTAADTEGVEHLHGEKGGGGTACGSHDCVCGDGGGGVHEVGVDEVVEEADEEEQEGGGEEASSDGGDDPVNGARERLLVGFVLNVDGIVMCK